MKQKVEVGDIVQLADNTKNLAFRFCIMTVTEIKDWGVQGYVQGLGTRQEQGEQYYYRAEYGTFRVTGGKAVWMVK